MLTKCPKRPLILLFNCKICNFNLYATIHTRPAIEEVLDCTNPSFLADETAPV